MPILEYLATTPETGFLAISVRNFLSFSFRITFPSSLLTRPLTDLMSLFISFSALTTSLSSE